MADNGPNLISSLYTCALVTFILIASIYVGVEAKASTAESDALEYFRLSAHVSQVRTLQPFVDYTLGSMEGSTSSRYDLHCIFPGDYTRVVL